MCKGPFAGEPDARVVDTEQKEYEKLLIEEWRWMEESVLRLVRSAHVF